jgi:hypothetical protein
MGIAVAAGLFAVAGFAGGAGAEMAAPSKPAKPKTVKVVGCAEKAVPDFCVKLGAYNVSGASPAVPVGKKVRLSGTVKSDSASPCPGTVLENIKWAQVKGKCAAPKGKK